MMMVMIYDIRLGRWKDGHLYFYVWYKEKEGQHGSVQILRTASLSTILRK